MPLRSTVLPLQPTTSAAERFQAWLAALPERSGLRVLRPSTRVPFDLVVLVPGGAVVRAAGRGRRLVVSLWAPGSARASVPLHLPERPEQAARGVVRLALTGPAIAHAGPTSDLAVDVHAAPTAQAALELPLRRADRSTDLLGAATLGVRADPDELDAALVLALRALLAVPAPRQGAGGRGLHQRAGGGRHDQRSRRT